MSVIQRTSIPAAALFQYRTPVFLRFSPLRQRPAVCERNACFSVCAATSSISSAHQRTYSSLVSADSFQPRVLFARGLTTSTGRPARFSSSCPPRGSLLQPNRSYCGSKLVPISTSSSRLLCSSAFSTEAASKNDRLQGRNARMVIQLGTREVRVPLVWLRDHCRCGNCYNSDTGQKMVERYTLDDDMAVMETRLEGDTLHVTWHDGHCSQYSLKWLDRNFHCPATRTERVLWDAARWTQQPLPRTSYEEHMNSEEGLRNTLSNIVKYGFCIVEGAPGTVEGTGEVADRIGFLMHTMFGIVERVETDVIRHNDTSYTNVALGPHTDTSYFSSPCGMQMFQIIYHDGEGGKTLLVDGFNQAEKVRTANPSQFRTLATTKVAHEFKEPSRFSYRLQDSVLATDERTDELIRLRYNLYDLAPLSNVAPDDIPAFYDSYGALINNINDEKSQFWMQLRPGTVLLVDNWRLVHGRSCYTGKRVLTTCYVSRDDWTSRARLFGLL